MPLTKGTRRTIFDVLLYAGVLAAGFYLLLSGGEKIAGGTPGKLDNTTDRPEHRTRAGRTRDSRRILMRRIHILSHGSVIALAAFTVACTGAVGGFIGILLCRYQFYSGRVYRR